MKVSASAPVIAVVSNDLLNAGVDWSVQCANAPCGSFSLAHTASGQATTFTAPAVVPAGSNILTVIATSTTDPTQTAQSAVSLIATISVQITQGVPSNTLAANATAQLIAIVTNDAANAGVDWTVACGSAECGSFSPPHTDSDQPTNYTAPSAPPAGGTVTITATSTSDKNQIASTPPITITASLLAGNFVFLLTGRDANQSFYSLSGTIVGDGLGNITGEADGIDSSNGGTTNLGGTYAVGKDGRGMITLELLNTNNFPSFGVSNGTNGVLTISVTFANPRHALLSETDAFGTGTGTLDFQDPNALAAFQNPSLPNGAGLNGTYSVVLSGTEAGNPNNKFFLASALATQFAAGTVTETGAVGDQSDNGVVTANAKATTGVGAIIGGGTADQFGRFLDQGPIDLGPNKLFLSGYIIDANHFVLNDFRDSFIFGGYMVIQPSPPAITGAYAFEESGTTASPAFVPQVAGGIFGCGAAGTLDVASLGGAPTANQAIQVACAPPMNGRGLITISGAAPIGISKFAAYPTIDKGLQIIEIDSNGPSGVGVALQQTISNPIAASDFAGKYASDFLASTTKGLEAFVGQLSSDGMSKVSGTVDVNSFDFGITDNPPAPPTGTPSTNATVGGSFTPNSNGRFLLTLTITPSSGPPPQPSPQITTLDLACYIVDANTCLSLGLDPAAPGVGIFQLQSGF
jgi:hypothetical protein